MPTPSRAAARWHSLHLHRYLDQDAFLVNALAPIVDKLTAQGRLERFFFLRYWQGGSHIRLRLKVADAVAAQVLEDVTAAIHAYFADHPGDDGGRERMRAEQAQPVLAALEGEEAVQVRPPDTVWPADYVPETGKYGGDEGVAIAESCFHVSSRAVLAALPALTSAPGRRLGLAFSAMLRALHASGMPEQDMAEFFARYCLIWAPYVFDPFLDNWPGLLAKQSGPLRAHARTVLAAAPRSEPFPDAVRDAWAAVQVAGDRILPQVTLAGPDASAAQRSQVLLTSYLHTHNNRLGLIPEQEAFLGFLGHHVLAPGGDGSLARLEAVRNSRERRNRITTGH